MLSGMSIRAIFLAFAFAGLIAGASFFELLPAWLALLLCGSLAAALFWLSQQHERELLSARRDAIRIARERERARARASAPMRAKIVQGFTEPLLMIDPARRIIEANSAAREAFGDDLMNRDLALFLRQPAALEVIRKVMDSREPAEGEFVTSSPVERHYAIRAAMVANDIPPPSNGDTGDEAQADPQEPPFFVVVAMHDITQAKMTERMRVDFIANASHELRTPLSTLIGFIETLRGPAQDDPEARARFLGIMQQEGDRMVRLIDDLLSLSRIELEKHVSPRESVNLGKLVAGVAKSLAPLLDGHQRRIDIILPEHAPLEARGDSDQLVQVLQNLVSNSVKYGREGTPIVIRVEEAGRLSKTNGPGFRITVSDQGEGIPPQHIPRLTERFYRVDSARSRRLGGTGLGLAIVKHIVERHRGELGIESEMGKGTSISFTLPRADPAASKPASRNQTVTESA